MNDETSKTGTTTASAARPAKKTAADFHPEVLRPYRVVEQEYERLFPSRTLCA